LREFIISYWPLVTQIVLGLFLFACAWIYLPLLWGAVWIPAPLRIVREMLRAADVKPGQKVVDLGAGDGRIVLVAALRFRAHAVGVEIDPIRCLIANGLIRLLGLRDRAHVVHGNLFEFDLTDADVVILYLWPSTNQRLTSRLLEQLRPGAKVVSYRFAFYGWTPVVLADRDHPDILVYEIGRSEPNLWAALEEREGADVSPSKGES
jgi:SAM-dependent methyltransferase